MNLPLLLDKVPAFLRRHKLVILLIRLVPAWRIVTLTFNKTATVTVDVSDDAARQVLLTREFEPEFFEIARAFLVPGTAVLDLGVNAGFCSFGLIATTSPSPGTSWHLFDANRHLCEVLALSRALYPQHEIVINHGCLSDRPGQASLHVEKSWGSSYIAQAGEEGELVENIVLDSYIADRKLEAISFAKMDIEGYEPFALRGAEKSLRAGLIGAIYCEVADELLRRQGRSARELIELFRSYKYECFWCKEADFQSGKVPAARVYTPREGGASVRLAPMDTFPDGYQTDLIAISRKGLFRNLLV